MITAVVLGWFSGLMFLPTRVGDDFTFKEVSFTGQYISLSDVCLPATEQ